MQDNNVLERIEKRLEAVEALALAEARTRKNYFWIEGFVIGRTEGEGLDGNHSVYVLLYAMGDHMQTPCVKVYPNQMKNLPKFIQNQVNLSGDYPVYSARGSAKAKVAEKGAFTPCPLFSIVRYDGKDTEMGPQKCLSGVVYWSNDAVQAEVQAKSGTTQQPATPPAKAKRQADTSLHMLKTRCQRVFSDEYVNDAMDFLAHKVSEGAQRDASKLSQEQRLEIVRWLNVGAERVKAAFEESRVAA